MACRTVWTEDEVEVFLERIFNVIRIYVPNTEIIPVSIKGNEYLSSITEVNVTDKLYQDRQLNVIIKAPNMDYYESHLPIKATFKRETYFHRKIIYRFDKVKKEIYVNIPKYFEIPEDDGMFDLQYLVLENMQSKGFSKWNRLDQLDEDHITAAFKEYARLHAVSNLIKIKVPYLLDKVLPENMVVELDDDCLMNARSYCEKCFKLDGTNRDLYKSVLDGLEESFSTIKSKPSEHHVILHANCSQNNVWFNYENGKPSKACLMNFQYSFLGSPAIDLCYFFFTSAPMNLLYNYQYYAKVYYDELISSCEKLDANENLLTFDQLINEWKIYAKYGFTLALFTFASKLRQEDEEVGDFVIFMNQEEIQTLTGALVGYMNNNGFFSF